MRTMISCVLISLLCLGVAPVAVQSPPEIHVDRYLSEADRRMAKGDVAGVYEAFRKYSLSATRARFHLAGGVTLQIGSSAIFRRLCPGRL